MSSIRDLMTEDHRHCDDLLAAVEQAVGGRDVDAARRAFDSFRAAMLAHFQGEEEILFPAFEAATGMTQGPTHVMRMEHEQIRQLLEEGLASLDESNVDAYLGVTDTLVVMMQQHNMKEENILYPMCDQHLGTQPAGLAATLSTRGGQL